MMSGARINLLKMILDKSYREGDFTLSSGAKSNFYCDLKPTILHPEGASMIGELCLEWMIEQSLTFQGVGGLTLGADPLVMAVSLAALQKGIVIPATMIRKEPKKHGTSRFIEGVENFKSGDRFIVMEDVVTTGGAAKKAIEILKDEGYSPTHVFSIVDREAGGAAEFKKLGCEFKSLFTLAELQAVYRRNNP
jgi:orotate phosphoribosyltransferase